MIKLDTVPPIDLDKPATVSWSDHVLVGNVTNGPGHSRHFETAREALAFATGEVPEDQRGNLWLMTAEHTYKPDEIAELQPIRGE